MSSLLVECYRRSRLELLLRWLRFWLAMSASRPGLTRSRPGLGSRRCASGLTAGVDDDVRFDMAPGVVAFFARLLDDLVLHGGSRHVGSGAAAGLGGSSLTSAFRTGCLRRLW